MNWLWRRRNRYESDAEGIEKAKLALEIARQIEHHATEAEQVHKELLRRNNFGVRVHRALGGMPPDWKVRP